MNKRNTVVIVMAIIGTVLVLNWANLATLVGVCLLILSKDIESNGLK